MLKQLFVVTALIIFVFMGNDAMAQYYSQIDTMEAEFVFGSSGDTITIPVNLVNSFAVGAFLFRIVFDDTLFHPFAVDLTSRTINFDLFGASFNDTGSVSFFATSWDPIENALEPGSGAIAEIRMAISPVALPGIYELTFQDRDSTSHENSLSNARGDSLVVPILVDGRVFIEISGTADGQPLPEGYSLSQNYPNPFNGGTRISFVLPRTENVKINIYDILGEKVAVLFDGRAPAGETVLYWDGKNFDNSEASSGVYFYRLEGTLGGSFSNKMILVK